MIPLLPLGGANMINSDIFIDKALHIGFANAVWMDDLKLQCETRLREYCNSENCPNHGNNWICPPGCGSLEECAEKVSKFDQGILLQSISELESNPNDEEYKNLNREHNLRLQTYLETYCGEFTEILALTSGGCVFCDTCAFPTPCVKPNLRMNSLSAYGIDVGKLCKVAGCEYAFAPEKLYLIALVLIK